MNSLEDLNRFGQSSIVFEDPQATSTFGTFVDDGLPVLNAFATEDSFYRIGDNPFGGNFVGAEGLDNDTDNNIKVTIRATGNHSGGGSGYFFDIPDNLPRNITATITSSAQILEYELIQTNVDMHYVINNTRVYLKNAPTEATSTPNNTLITVSVEWDQSTSPAPNIRTQTTILTLTQLPELGNTGDRTYISGQFNTIFNSNPIEILDENFYAPDFDDVEYDENSVTNPEQYALTLNTSVGSWKTLTNSAPYPSVVTLFGTKDQIQSQVQSLIYVPEAGSIATATVSYYLETPTVTFDSVRDTYPVNWQRTVDNVTFDIVGIQRTTPAPWEIEYNHNTPITVTEEMILFSQADVLAVGGGGGGGAVSTRTQLTANEDGLTGGGGGSGYFFEMQGSNLLQQANPGDVITLVRGIGGLGAGWNFLQYPQNGTASEILINSTPVVVAPGGGRGGSSYNAPNQPYGLGTPTTAFVEFNGTDGGMGGGAAGSNLNMPNGGQTYGGAGGVGAVNTLTTAGGITQTFGLNGDNGFETSSAWEAGGGGGTPTTGGTNSIPSGPVITSQVVDPGTQFCEHAPEGGRSISQYNPTQYTGSGGKGMGYNYYSNAPRTVWDAQNGHNGIIKVRIRQA